MVCATLLCPFESMPSGFIGTKQMSCGQELWKKGAMHCDVSCPALFGHGEYLYAAFVSFFDSRLWSY